MNFLLAHTHMIAGLLLGLGGIYFMARTVSTIDELDEEAQFRLGERLFPSERYAAMGSARGDLEPDAIVIDRPISLAEYKSLRDQVEAGQNVVIV